MPTPFQFDQLQQSAKVMIVAFAIFLLTLALGMLAFGQEGVSASVLGTETLHNGKDFVHLAP